MENNSSEEHALNLEGRKRNWLMDNPLISSILIAVLVGIFLQMTWIIGVQELAGAFTSDILTILLADFGFCMAMGLILILLIIPFMFGYHRKNAPLREYGEHMRVKKGVSITKTI